MWFRETSELEIRADSVSTSPAIQESVSSLRPSTQFDLTRNIITGVTLSAQGRSPANPVTATAEFSGIAGQSYYIQPPGANTAFEATYSGNNYKNTDTGYFSWYETADQSSPSLNLLGNGYQFNVMMVEKTGSDWQTVGFNSYQTFNTRGNESQPITADFGTRSGYRVYFGYAGGHGIYNTGQGTCNWGSSAGAIGAGYNGSTCGTYPNNLMMGTGTGNNTYTNRGGNWTYWFSF